MGDNNARMGWNKRVIMVRIVDIDGQNKAIRVTGLRGL